MRIAKLLLTFLYFGCEINAYPFQFPTQWPTKPPNYFALMPGYIRKGIPYSVDVELVGSNPDPLDFEVQLRSGDNGQTSKFQLNSEEKAVRIDFSPDPLIDKDGGSPEVIITTKRNGAGGEVVSTDRTPVVILRKTCSIFIETDKPIYNPGQTIKFRAVITTPDLLPYQGNASYYLSDPGGNIILKESNAALNHGVVGNEFKLGRYSTLGNWEIKFEANGDRQSVFVSVEEYKLPKWKIDLKIDQSVLHSGMERLTGELTAEYTFGRPLRGSAVIAVKNEIPYYPLNYGVFSFTGEEPSVTTLFPVFNGSITFDLDVADLRSLMLSDYDSLEVVANVTDKNTGETRQAFAYVARSSVIYEIEDADEPNSAKPGLPFVHQLRLRRLDGKPLSNEELQDLEVIIDIRYKIAPNSSLSYKENFARNIDTSVTVTPEPDGLITWRTIIGNIDLNYIRLSARVPKFAEQLRPSYSAIGGFQSPTKTFIQLVVENDNLVEGDLARLEVQLTKPSDTYRIFMTTQRRVVLSEVIQSDHYDVHETYFSFEYSFQVGKEHSPRVQVFVMLVTEDGEFVADSVNIDVRSASNLYKITALPNVTDAGMPVSIKVQTEPGSFVGLKGIDQSVLLLKKGNDISEHKIVKQKFEYAGGWRGTGREYSFSVSAVIANSELIIVTDGTVYDVNICQMGFPAEGICYDTNEAFIENMAGRKENEKRSYFPDSWIWTEEKAGSDGTVTFNYTVPDTITTWELSSFSVSDDKGLGVPKEKSRITVFRNFFIQLDLPPSIVKGEILKMKAILFNYFEHDVAATVVLEDNEWYEIFSAEGEGLVRTVTVPSKNSVVVVFPIEFTKAGLSSIVISAQSAAAGDRVQRRLRVKPEGIPMVVSQSNFIKRRDEEETESVVHFDVDIPHEAVEGSVYAKLTVTGSILGSPIKHLGNLLKMPYGCGEQNMINFAPDVFISLYLKRVNRLSGQFKRKSESHIREGYQNELRYRHQSGAFSTFGESRSTESTWLTAFVVKVLRAAKELNPDLIEDKKINEAITFILAQQRNNGTFTETGRVIDKFIQGGIDSEITVAAYILIALTEGGKLQEISGMEAALDKTQRFLESKITHIEDIFTFSIVGYALSLVESELAPPVLSLLDSMARTEGSMRYWAKEERGAAKCVEEELYCPFDSSSTSSSIEITSYILLSYLKQGRSNEVLPIAEWLAKQRSHFGGYHSTQDTVMAIQALSEVARHFNGDSSISIDIRHEGLPEYEASVQVMRENAIILQTIELPNVAGQVSVSAVGHGIAIVQVTVGYNLPDEPGSDEPFILETELTKPGGIMKLEVCSSINEERDEVLEKTGMYVVNFKLPSGYTIDDKEATEQNPQSALIELVGEEVTAYFDEISREEKLCFTLELTKIAEIENLQPQIITCYDYYQPEIKAMTMLNLLEAEKGLGEPPTDSYCGTDAFPCPDFVDGLFYDPSSHVTQLIMSYPSSNSCTAPHGVGDSRLFAGIPASHLNGVNEYIECSRYDFQSILRNPEGWTFSIAAYPTALYWGNYYTIASISSENAAKPFVFLAKKSRSHQYWLRILLDGHLFTVRSIHTRQIPLKQWSLITIRFMHGTPNVFANGRKVGRYSRRRYATDDIEEPVSLKVGKSPDETTRKGNFKGLVANLDVWKKPLTDTEIWNHYNYWQSSISQANPTLDVAKVHHFVPQSIRKCFTTSYTALELKSEAGYLQTGCNGI